VIRAAQTLASNMADLSTAQGKFDAANIGLMNYMAISPEKRRPVSGDLGSEQPQGNRAESLALASLFRADFKKLKEQLGYQKNQIDVERSSALPKVTLGASGGMSSPYGNRDETDDTWKAELSVTIPIFDRNVSRSSVLKAKATLEQNRLELEQKELDIKSEVETAWTEIEASKLRLAASSKALEFSVESLRLAEVGYREGVSPQLDLLAAQSTLTSAMLDHASAKYNHLMALVALKMTEGTIIEWSRGITK
ncbi:MAG: TolC family protein, partial [Synergistaceae bacterium]